MLSPASGRAILSAGALLVCGGAYGLYLWEQAPFNTDEGPFDDTVWYGYTGSATAGLIAFLSLTPVGVVLVVTATLASLRAAPAALTPRVQLLLLALLFLAGGVVPLAIWAEPLWTCGLVFCANVDKYGIFPAKRGTSFNATISFILFGTLVPLSLLLASRLALVNNDRHPTPSRHRCGVAVPQAARVSLLLLYIVFWCLVSAHLPNDPRRYVSGFLAYFARLQTNDPSDLMTYTRPELPGAVFTTWTVRLGEQCALRFYPGNSIYFAYLAVVAVGGACVHGCPPLRRALACPLPGRATAWSCPSALFVAVTAIFSLAFLWYWVHDHNYKNLWVDGAPVAGYMPAVDIWARAAGQLATLLVAIVSFPMARHSPVYACLGVSRDGVLWVHRVFGYAALAATVAHAGLFYVSYYRRGTLWHNLAYIPTVVGATRVRNDFTVNLVTPATALALVCMGLLALHTVRRRCYELFYYAHLVAAHALYPALLYHASGGWSLLLPPLALWLLDLLLRVWQHSAPAAVLYARALDGRIAEVAVAAPFAIPPGAYVYLNVPELSALEWHPFTPFVSDADATRLLFQAGTEGSWTARLHALVAAGRSFTVGLEGPYGGGGVPADGCDAVVLVAGGIGAAPCVAYYSAALRGQAPAVRRATLVWVTRSAALVGAVADAVGLPPCCRSLVPLPAPPDAPAVPGPRGDGAKGGAATACDLRLFCTGAAAEGFARCECPPTSSPRPSSAAYNVACEGRRPDIAAEVRRAVAESGAGTLVFACGPESLTDAVRAAGADCGVVVHTELFLF